MKKARLLCLCLCVLTLALCCLVTTGCKDDKPDPAETGTDTTGATAAPTDPAAPTEAPTEEATEAPTEAATMWSPDMGTFNEGRITYTKTVETEKVDEYPDVQLGEPMSAGDKGVVTLFTTDYDGDDPTCGGKMAVRAGGTAKVLDGVLYFPYSDQTADHIISDGWSTYSVVTPASVKTYKQVALSLDWTIVARGSGAWMTATWGCYVSNYAGKIPDGPGDGLWLSFNPMANLIRVYHPDAPSWPAAWGEIPVETGMLGGMIHTDIVCCDDKSTYIYLTAEGSADRVLAGMIRFEDGKIRIYNGEGTMLKEDTCSTNALQGENFSLFTHAGGGAMIDKLDLLGASKGEVRENVTVTAVPAEGQTLGLDITDKTDLVSINYSVWFDAILGAGSDKVTKYNDITEILAGRQEWGGSPSFHYWAKPGCGYYYRSSDKDVIRTHMTQLYEAGVDFIVIDLTNAGDGYIGNAAWTTYIEIPMVAILDTIMEMRAEGKGTPYVVFWSGSSDGPLYQALFDRFHNVDKWKDCFVYWDNKPLLITTHTDPADFPLKDLYTVRMMWGLSNDHVAYHWSFLNVNNCGTESCTPDGKPEQVSVAVATQETYMSASTAHGRNHGIFWYAQWAYAFRVHPKIVGLTWWNEWAAQRLSVDGQFVFTDNYNEEYSRDIEPMTGGHGDQYYQWMKQYIAAYKSHAECPVLVEEGFEEKAGKEYQTLLRKAGIK